MIYLDISAAAKLVHAEAESPQLAAYLAAQNPAPLVSSALLYPELVRAVTRHRPELLSRAVLLAQRMMTVPVTADILVSAATIGTPALRTLDAIHLATAATVSAELRAVVTYDKRLADAASAIGLSVLAPA